MKKIICAMLCCHAFAGPVAAQYSWDHLPQAAEPRFKKDTFSIVSFGAVADGIALNTKAINEAIGACSRKGGGVVLIPKGLWRTGPVVLQSHVNLHLDRAAILQFTRDFDQYPLVQGNWEGRNTFRNQSPISGTGLEEIAITGTGVIDGNGDAWRMITKDRLSEGDWKKKLASGGVVSSDGRTWYPSEKTRKGQQMTADGSMANLHAAEDFLPVKDFLRPNLVVFTNCRKILLEGTTFENSPAWCLHPLLCEDLTLRDIKVRNPEYAQNGDGVDVESCRNVRIEGSTFDCGDDGICIKSGRDEEGRRRGKPTENVLVQNCIVYKAHGGFVIGSEMSGGARNLFVQDCSFIGTDKGLRFKTARGRGGIVEKIFCRNISMKDIVGEAIYFDMYYFTRPPKPGEVAVIPAVTEATPQFRDFHISHIVCDGAAQAIFLRGLPEMNLSDIYLDHIAIQSNKGISITEAKGIHLHDIQLAVTATDPLVWLENSRDIELDGLTGRTAASLLFSVNGERSKNIFVQHASVAGTRENVAFGPGAPAGSIHFN